MAKTQKNFKNSHLEPHEITKIRDMTLEGYSASYVAAELNRSVATVQKYTRLNKWKRPSQLPPAPKKELNRSILQLPLEEKSTQHNTNMLEEYEATLEQLKLPALKNSLTVSELKTRTEIVEKLNKLGRSILNMDSEQGARVVNLVNITATPTETAQAMEVATKAVKAATKLSSNSTDNAAFELLPEHKQDSSAPTGKTTKVA